jgi:ABC-2 type transport system permease protein
VTGGSPAALVARQQLGMLRRGALVLGGAEAALLAVNIVAFVSAYPTRADRVAVARSLGSSTGITALLGEPLGIDTLTGFVQWRTTTALVLIGGIWGLLAGTRVLRGEEEAGRLELVLAAPVSAARAALGAFAALGGATALVWLLVAPALLVAGSAAHGFPVERSLLFSVVAVSPVLVFAAVGGLISQVAATRRQAATIGATLFGLAWVLRIAADSASSLDWLRWTTPFGWLGQVHPLTGPRPAVLALPLAFVAASVWASTAIARRRDLGAGLLRTTDRRRPNLRLLRSAPAQALRAGIGVAVAWAAGAGTMALLMGVLAKSAADALSKSGGIVTSAGRVGGADVASVAGYLSLAFLFIIVGVSCFAASLAGAVREEESSSRLDAVLSRSVSRSAWLAGRLGVGVALLAFVSVACGLLGWAGTRLAGSPVAFGRMLEAGLNGLPVAVLILGLGALAYGAVPRHTAGLAYGFIAAAFLVEFIGASVQAPAWVLDLSPFHHLAAVPAESIDWGPALAMLGLGVAAAVAGAACFARRDLATGH